MNEAFTAALAPRLDLERQRPAPQRGTLVKSRTKVLHYPVSIPEAGVIRIQWRGPQTRITPNLERMLAGISRHVALKDAPPGTATARPAPEAARPLTARGALGTGG